MRQINYRRVFLVAGIGALILIYFIFWMKMILDPAQRTGADFIAFYAGGRVANLFGYTRVYEIDLLQSIQESVVGFPLADGQVLIYNNVPFLVPLIGFFMGENYLASFCAWSLTMFLFFLLVVTILARLFYNLGWNKSTIVESWFGLLLFFPVFVSLLNGQVTALTTLGLSLWLFGLHKERMWMAGLGLALVTIRPQIALLLAIPFLFRYRLVFLWFFAGCAGLFFFSWFSVGWMGMMGFVDQLFLSAQGDFFGMQESAMVSLLGMLLRLFPAQNIQVIHWMSWSAFLGALIVLCIIWLKNHSLDERHYCLAVCSALLFSPHLHYHDLALLLVPITCLMLYFSRNRMLSSQASALFPLGFSLFLLLGSLVPGIKFDIPIILMVFLAISPWIWKNFTPQKPPL